MRLAAAIERPLVRLVIAVAALALVAHATEALAAGHVTLLGGVWLALARDLDAGVFYRDFLSDAGYGGTRYFPLFFLTIAGFMKAGAGVLASGWLASAVSAAVLIGGMYRLVRALGGARLLAALFAAAAIAPYFVQQTLFEIRADVLAAALNVWGLAFLLPEWGGDPGARSRPGWSAFCFTLALATKANSLAIPLAGLVAIAAAGRPKIALAVCWRLAVGAVLFLLLAYWASDGRAIASWRACMFAATSAGGMLDSLLAGDALRLTRYSRLLAALLAATTLALVAAFVLAGRAADRTRDRRALLVPAGLLTGASLSAALALSSPGTVPSNHMVEWIEIALSVLAFLACTRAAMTRGLTVVTVGLVLWASAQDVRAARDLEAAWWASAVGAAPGQALAERVKAAPGPVLSESPLWPLLAGQRAYLLDPFALRVVMQSRPDVERDLVAKIDRQVFSLVIFEMDPTTAAGRGFYEHVNFGWAVIGKVLERYEFAGRPRSDAYLYVPRRASEPGH